MCCDHSLDFGRVDVEAAGDDEISLAVAEADVAVFVHAGQIAAAIPAFFCEGVGCRFGAVPVSTHQVCGVHEELSDLAWSDVCLLAVDCSDIYSRGSTPGA